MCGGLVGRRDGSRRELGGVVGWWDGGVVGD